MNLAKLWEILKALPQIWALVKPLIDLISGLLKEDRQALVCDVANGCQLKEPEKISAAFARAFDLKKSAQLPEAPKPPSRKRRK